MRALGFTYFSIGRWVRPRDGRRRVHRQPRRQSAPSRRYHVVVCDNVASAQRCAGTDIGAVMHVTAFLDVVESVREPVRYDRNKPGTRYPFPMAPAHATD
jgi:hypothetical protein